MEHRGKHLALEHKDLLSAIQNSRKPLIMTNPFTSFPGVKAGSSSEEDRKFNGISPVLKPVTMAEKQPLMQCNVLRNTVMMRQHITSDKYITRKVGLPANDAVWLDD